MVAGIGWLQRNSGRSNEGRVSWSWLRENSIRSMAAALRRRSGFPWVAGPLVLLQRVLGARRVPAGAGLSDAPDAGEGSS